MLTSKINWDIGGQTFRNKILSRLLKKKVMGCCANKENKEEEDSYNCMFRKRPGPSQRIAKLPSSVETPPSESSTNEQICLKLKN